ncbi:MAG: hypothetical protein H0A75_03380 [Candidatus Methanofishera endochildressiae]|uniref:Uncharacterized protein n=1 Tax=Candidatus Methanofishera endochildressiae TaxID=2738884 RepID=A0A7Z0MNB9_9GAMM|nr:hypothetical protein [Candidatus Methanofishera endochildressiae]
MYLFEEIDMLFDWLEVNESQYFPHHAKTERHPFFGNKMTRWYDDGVLIFDYPNITKYEEGFFETKLVHFDNVDAWLWASGVDRRLANKKDAARKAVKDEKARVEAEKARLEEEERLAKIAWEEANRGRMTLITRNQILMTSR